MHEKHAGRAADCASAMAATADIIGEKDFTAAASVLFSVAGFDLQCAGQHDKQLTPRGWMPVLIEAFWHLRYHRALRRQNGGAADGIAERVGRRCQKAGWDEWMAVFDRTKGCCHWPENPPTPALHDQFAELTHTTARPARG